MYIHTIESDVPAVAALRIVAMESRKPFNAQKCVKMDATNIVACVSSDGLLYTNMIDAKRSASMRLGMSARLVSLVQCAQLLGLIKARDAKVFMFEQKQKSKKTDEIDRARALVISAKQLGLKLSALQVKRCTALLGHEYDRIMQHKVCTYK